MDRAFRLRRNGVALGLISLVGVLATWVLFSGMTQRAALSADSPSHFRRPTGSAQLVSVEPLPEMDGQMCEWTPASASTTLMAALPQGRPAASGAAPASEGGQRTVDIDRAPVRMIRDPNPAFSAVAVEPESNMLVVTDENLFQVLEYDRRDSTPSNAKMTEPKRVIQGTNTKAEMMCGVYIDPKTLDTYIINNDTQDWMVVFSKEARGNVAPNRFLAVPHGTFGIAVDEGRQELYLTVQHQNSVVTYRKMASGEEKPLRELWGDATELEDPHGVAVDTKRNLLFVSNHGSVSYRTKSDGSPIEPGEGRGRGAGRTYVNGTGKFRPPSITVYTLDANGNTAPLRIIEGPKTQLNWPMQIAVHEERGELFVANDMDHSIVVFRVTDNGDAVPVRTIKGPKSGIKNPTGIALDLKNGELLVANMGAHSATSYPLTASGDVAPLRSIRGGPANEPSLMIGNPGGVGYDSKREEILVPN